MLLAQEGIDVNAKGDQLFYSIFVLLISYFKIMFGTNFYYLKQHLYLQLKKKALRL